MNTENPNDIQFSDVAEPQSSPWGAVQHANHLAAGIWSVDTASHGGIFLSPERLAAMPENYRTKSFAGGAWFEEDCDWALVVDTFPEAFKPEHVALAKDLIGKFHPDLVEVQK